MKRLTQGDKIRANLFTLSRREHYDHATCAAIIRKSVSTYERKLREPDTFTIGELTLLSRTFNVTLQDLIS